MTHPIRFEEALQFEGAEEVTVWAQVYSVLVARHGPDFSAGKADEAVLLARARLQTMRVAQALRDSRKGKQGDSK